MRSFKVTVNGVTYDVGVEEVFDGNYNTISSAQKKTQPLQNKSNENVQNESASPNAFKLLAPMAGTISDIKVNVGDIVSKDQIGLILEAMKMENEIFIPVAGKVTSICVQKGNSVNADDVLLTVE